MPTQTDDTTLNALESDIIIAVTVDYIGASADGVSEATREIIRQYVAHLKRLDCPPEAVLIHIKRLVSTFEPASHTSPHEEWANYDAVRNALVLTCVEEYFGYRRPRAGRDAPEPRE